MSQLNVLFVDDEQAILRSMKRLLRNEEYHIDCANSPTEGFEVLSQKSISLLVSDQKMPEMEGTVFLAKVKEQYPHIVRVILSGSPSSNEIVKAKDQGVIHDSLQKPWDTQELKQKIREWLELSCRQS